MKKFKFLVKHGYLKRVKRKAFLITNIIIAILVILFANIANIISLVIPDDKDKIPSVDNVHILVDSHLEESINLISDLQIILNEGFEEDIYIIENAHLENISIESFWELDHYIAYLVISQDNDSFKINAYTKEHWLMPQIERDIEHLLLSYQISDYQPPQFIEEFKDLDAEDIDDVQKGKTAIVANILAVPMFILILMGTQFIGVDIIEEKSTKAIETIISSVPAKTHFFGKIFATLLFIITQTLLLVVYLVIGGLISRLFGSLSTDVAGGSILDLLQETIPNWPLVFGISAVFMLLGTLLYLVFAALFAAMATIQEDYQQMQTPVMLFLLASFYIAIFAPLADGTLFLKIISYIPLFSPLIAPIAFVSGAITIWELLLILLILIGFLILVVYLISPVYRVSILSYDQTKFFTRIKNYFKKGFSQNRKNKL